MPSPYAYKVATLGRADLWSHSVALLAQDEELYVFAESHDRIAKERGMRRRRLEWLWARLKQLSTMSKVTREGLLMKLGAAQSKAPPHGDWSASRSPPAAPPLATGSIAGSCAKRAAAKVAIYCAPT